MTTSHTKPVPAGGRLWSHESGNIAILTALLMLPVLFAMGMAFDFTLAQSRKDQIAGMADAAALGAVTPSEMSQTSTVAAARSKTLLLGQMANVIGVTYNNGDVTTAATDTDSGTDVNRSATVNWTASSHNVFGSLLGMATMPISGSSTAASSTAPSINFYLLLDSSPSMLLAATPQGVCQLSKATCTTNGNDNNVGLPCSTNTQINCATWTANPATTPQLAGCAFACHEQNASTDTPDNPNGEDNYAVARGLNITLRSDLVQEAAQNLMNTAYITEKGNKATYKVAIYTIDATLTKLQALTSCLSTSQNCSGPAYTTAGNYAPLEVVTNNTLTTGANNDEDSNLDLGLSSMDQTTYIAAPGTGAPGASPQAVLFIVSDGMLDEADASATTSSACGPNRICAPVNTVAAQDWCSAIKARGIRIAFLYTTYQPLSNSGWNATDNVFNVEYPGTGLVTAAQSCASTGLFFQVDSGGDISAALQTLFQEAVATARLTH